MLKKRIVNLSELLKFFLEKSLNILKAFSYSYNDDSYFHLNVGAILIKNRIFQQICGFTKSYLLKKRIINLSELLNFFSKKSLNILKDFHIATTMIGAFT